MVKVVWFLRKAEHLSMDEFRHWWLNEHAQKVLDQQGPMLERYIINIRNDIDDLPGAPQTSFNWDGMAEEWFKNEEAARQAFTLPSASETRDDVIAHTSEISRFIVTEHHIID